MIHPETADNIVDIVVIMFEPMWRSVTLTLRGGKSYRYILRLVARRGRGKFLPTSRCSNSRLSSIFGRTILVLTGTAHILWRHISSE